MKKWLLIVVEEREIREPRIFDTHEEAYAAMEQVLIQQIKYNSDEREYLTDDGKLICNEDEEFEIHEDYMWSNLWHDENVDAKIFEIDM